ncbi:hypothetical protein ACJIZ3_023764 [Penstemon smallii]|uniref:Uncharacterized protein n=1 Tax=Penstemon smallii TaxID=265156 RepID=A0ABD3TSE1_9LAMI
MKIFGIFYTVTVSKRSKKYLVNSRNVRSKFEEEKVKCKHKRGKMKSANIDEENDLNTTGEKDLMEHIKINIIHFRIVQNYFININNDKKAMYKEYKEKLPQRLARNKRLWLDGILELRPSKICRELCLLLVNEFDCDTCMLNINGRKISVGHSDIIYVLGLEDHGVRADLLNMEDADEQFKRKFALYMFGFFFKFLSLTKDINKLVEINLAHLVFECSVEGIRERQQTKNMYARGSLAFFYGKYHINFKS